MKYTHAREKRNLYLQINLKEHILEAIDADKGIRIAHVCLDDPLKAIKAVKKAIKPSLFRRLTRMLRGWRTEKFHKGLAEPETKTEETAEAKTEELPKPTIPESPVATKPVEAKLTAPITETFADIQEKASKYGLLKSEKELATIAYYLRARGRIELDRNFPLICFKGPIKFAKKFAYLVNEELSQPKMRTKLSIRQDCNVFVFGKRAVVLAALIRKYLPRDLATETDKLIEWYTCAIGGDMNAQNQESQNN